MSNHHRSAIFQILLIACLFCSSSILHGQSTEIRPPTYSPDPLPSIPTPSPYQKPSLRKFAFKNAKATDVFKIQCQLAGEENLHSVAVDERTNSIIYLTDDPKDREIEEFYVLLDTEPQTPTVAGNGVSISVPALGPKPLLFDFSFGFLRDGESVETLKNRYNELEQQAHQLAGKLKQSKSLSESERSELKAAVRKSFEARQALQRAELADLAQRMKNMQQSIDMRDKLAEKVIERRIEDLLNPNLKWDTTNTSEQMPANGGMVKSESKLAPRQSDSKPQPSGLNNRSSLPSAVLPVNNGPIIQGIRQEVQGNWIVESISTAGENGLDNVETPLILNIKGDLLTNPKLNDQSMYLRWRGHSEKSDDGQSFNAVDLVVDRNGEDEAWCAGIISCDKDRLRICFTKGYYDKMSTEGIRPSGFLSGPNVSLIECRREPKAASKANESNEADLSTPAATLAAESSKTEPPEWNEFLKQVPESGTALVMFSYEPEVKEQMLPVAKKVAEAASVQLIELPQTTWRKIIAPPATHFVLMKDRQVVGTRTGLMTETRLQDFVGKAKDWLTPQSIGIDESSLVRIDCYINPGRGNAGSQHGGAFPLTTAVVAVHNDQALLLGPDSIAGYIEGGYACVAVVRDEAGKQKQLPLDVLFKGPVKLLGRKTEAPTLEGSVRVKDGNGTVSEVPFASIYPESVTQILEAYDVGTAIYHIRGVHGLSPTKLAAIDAVPQVDQRVLSGGFARERHLPPIHGFSSPLLWQSQTIQSVGGIYGNMNGAELFTVNCPRLPAPVGFTFDEHGRLIGRYGLGSPSDKDMTHTVFQTYATHSILHAGMEKIEDAGLKAALAQTLEESKTAASVKDENRQTTIDAADATSSQPSTNPPAKFDTPQALLARVDESSKAGSYEEFIALFSEEGVRDLAGSMLMSAVMQTSIDELTQQMSGGLAEVNPDFVAFRKVLQRWLPQSVTTAQQEAMGKGLSTIMSSIGGASPDHAALNEFVISLRESVAGIGDHRKFCIEIMQAFERLTKRKFVFFGNADHENEWQIPPFGDRAIATLIDGSPGMATTITLQQANGTWRISSLFNELVIEAQPATTSPTSNASIPSNAKTVTRRYSVGSFVTESFFTDKVNSETQEAYDKHEPEIEQSMQDLAKTVTATCSQPPKFVQVLSNSRCLLIGHTEAGHQEIADFMRDIGINNDRIRLRGVTIEITKDEAKSLGIELSHHVVLRSTEDAEKLRTFQKDEKSDSENSSRDGHYRENSSRDFHFVAMEAMIQSGTRTHMKTSNGLEQVPIAARIVPGTKEVQIRIDLYGYSDGSEHFHPQFQTLTDGQSVVFALAGDLWWLGTADIVRDANAVSEKTDKAASNPQGPSTPVAEILQRLQGEWNVKIVNFSAGDPKDLVIRDDLLLLPGNLLGKSIVTSLKLDWPNPNIPEEVDIIWEPNDQPNANAIMEPLVGRIRCKGDQLQLCFLDGSRKVTQRPREMCGGTGIFYLECTRKQASVLSKSLKASESAAQSSQGLKYSGQTLSWWLDSYWENSTAIPKTAENASQEFVASEAIRKLREKPECEAVIETALAKWFASMEHEVNEGQLTRAAKCIVTVAGPAHQETAVQLLFKIWKRMPLLTYAEQGDMADDATELNQLLSQLVLNDQLAAQFAERLTHGGSSDRSLILYGLLSLMGRFGVETDNDQAQLESWLSQHAEQLAPAIEAASHDENEKIRMTSLIQLATLIHHTKLNPESARLPTILLDAISDASPDIRSMAILLLASKELAPTVKSQNVLIIPTLNQVIESDTSIDVRYSALEGLMQLDATSELVHKTLMEWAKCDDCEKAKYAIMLTLRNYQAGDRPQSIDELIELLSDPEWGTTVEVKEHNWSTYHRWARQYAIAILGRYAAHAHRAIPTLEAELARNNKDTLSFATEALDRVRGGGSPH